MTIFIVICVALALATMVGLVRPLLRKSATETGPTAIEGSSAELRSAQNLVIARERIDELDSLRASGDINDSDYALGRSDIERALASELTPSNAHVDQPPSRWLGALLIIAIPVLSVWLYTATGTPQAMDPVFKIASQQPNTREDVEGMVDQLAKRMESDPDNVQGWYRLTQSYMVLGRFPESLQAMENIRRLEGETPDVLSMFGQGYMVMQRYDDAVGVLKKLRKSQGDTPDTLLRIADALAMQQSAQLAGEPETLILQALGQEPENIRALWMAGMAARQRGDGTVALAHWEKLAPLITDQPESLKELNALMQDTRTELTGTADTTSVNNQITNTSGDTADAGAVSVTINVSLDDGLRANAKPDDVVFIFARAAQGPRMPLAAHKTTVSALPLTMTFTDADAMTPQMKLSSVDQVRIVARVSKQEQPMAAAGDLQGESDVIDVKSSPQVVLVIDKVVE